MASTTEQAATLLRARLTELEDEAEQVKIALEAIEGKSNAKPRQRRSGARSGPSRVKRTATGRAKKGERQAQFKATLKKNPNYKLSDISKSMGISNNNASSLARQLQDSGEIKKIGRGQYALA